MTTDWWKIGVLLGTVFLTTYAAVHQNPVEIAEHNGCALRYKTDVSDRPDIFVVITITPGLCRLQKHQWESTQNYEPLAITYYARESALEYDMPRGLPKPGLVQRAKVKNFQGLSCDVRSKSLMYIVRNINDWKQEELVRRQFNDSRVINRVNLRSRYGNSSLKNEEMDDLAYDWRTKNLFINNKKGISVINVNQPWQPIDVVVGASNILCFAIHPNAGYLFYVDSIRLTNDTDIYTSSIYRTYLDGSNKRPVGPTITYPHALIVNLAIDYHTDRLYWSLPGQNMIQSSKLDGTDIKNIVGREVYHGMFNDGSNSISFDKKFVYYIEKNTRSVRRFDKDTLREDKEFEIFNKQDALISEVMVYDPEAHKITTDHPCLVNNGGCEKYCLAWPKDHPTKDLSRTCRNDRL